MKKYVGDYGPRHIWMEKCLLERRRTSFISGIDIWIAAISIYTPNQMASIQKRKENKPALFLLQRV
jgi:hypothetical protein